MMTLNKQRLELKAILLTALSPSFLVFLGAKILGEHFRSI